MNALSPYDALLVVSYGGPNGPDDVLPFMRNATRGRGIPDERLVEVSQHYLMFGGKSPINERNAELLDALRAGLAAAGAGDVPVVIGNRNWHPFIAETVQSLADAGARRVLVMFTAAYSSYSGCRQYREDLARALAEVGPAGASLVFDKIGPYAESDGFVDATARSVVEALSSRDQDFLHQARVVFVTHSIPTAMDAASGPGGPEGTYSAQHRRVAERAMALAAEELGFAPAWEIAYCSRSGAPHIPWLEPDVNDRLAELATEGVSKVVAVPFGFINDHMEVVYDLDTQAKETAAELGVEYVRAATVGTDPAFVDELVGRLLQRAAVARGEAAEPEDSRYRCASGCCRGGRPGAPDLPALFQAQA